MGVWDGASLLSFEADIDRAWPSARLLLLGDSGDVVPPDQAPMAADLGPLLPSDLFVGYFAGTPWFARHVPRLKAGVQSRLVDLPDGQRQLVTRALALTAWHATEPRCEQCGDLSSPAPGGRTRRCTTCGTELFPRTDPAVIVAVIDRDDRLLLAHHTAWDIGRVSVLAGFVEAGESAEQACYREIAEESGVVIDRLRFFGTQPWPYPRSLMLGFIATTSDTDVIVDGVELEWGGFYARDEVVRQVAEGALVLPGRASIASRMVDFWLRDKLGAVS